MRMDAFDVLVGINLYEKVLIFLRLHLLLFLDADKEGFLRTETSLIQTIGRAARNSEDMLLCMPIRLRNQWKAISETERRRQIQQEYNEEHGITPQTIKKAVRDLISISKAADASSGNGETLEKDYESMSRKELEKVKKQIEKNMHKAAAELNFEEAAVLRDKMIEVNKFFI
ncbi:MAG: UvrB/UvrC motif-containing protein [Lachnospira eligens]